MVGIRSGKPSPMVLCPIQDIIGPNVDKSRSIDLGLEVDHVPNLTRPLEALIGGGLHRPFSINRKHYVRHG